MDNENINLPVDEETSVIEEDSATEIEVEEEVVETSAEAETEVKTEEHPTIRTAYNLNDIPEYIELQNNYNTLQDQYNTLDQNYQALNQEVESLRIFKLSADRKDKEAMIASFYMLSDEDKKDVIDNIDKYSVNDIEAKLSIICFRNKVDFNIGNEEPAQQYMLNLNYNQANDDDDDAPAWVKAVRQNAN